MPTNASSSHAANLLWPRGACEDPSARPFTRCRQIETTCFGWPWVTHPAPILDSRHSGDLVDADGTVAWRRRRGWSWVGAMGAPDLQQRVALFDPLAGVRWRPLFDSFEDSLGRGA
jgi:hypothetical protein